MTSFVAKCRFIKKVSVHFLLSASILTASAPVQADRKIASLRAAPPIRIHQENVWLMSASDEVTMNRAFLDFLVRKYAHAHSFSEIEEAFLLPGHVTQAEVKKLKKEFDPAETRPILHRENDSLIFEVPGQKLVIEWPDPLRLQLKINGMPWTFNKYQPLLYQFALMSKKLAMREKGRSALMRILLPESRAGILGAAAKEVGEVVEPAVKSTAKRIGSFLWSRVFVEALIIGGVGYAVMPNLGTVTCALGIADTPWETKWGLCYQWRKDLDDATARRKDRVGKVDGLEKSKVDAAQKEDLKYLPDADNMCTTLADKTKTNYVVDFRAMKRSADGRFVPDGDWFSVVQYYTPAGLADKFVVTAKGIDTSDPQWKTKAKAVLNFEAGHLSTISYPNPNYQFTDPTSQSVLKQDTATDDTLLTAEQRSRRDTMLLLTKSINTWTHFCDEINFVKDLKGNNVKVDDPNPSPQVGTPLSAIPAAQPIPTTSIINISK